MAGMWRCYWCDRENLLRKGVDFEADGPQCPRCKSGPPVVVPLALIHLLVEGDGPITGMNGRRYQVACSKNAMLSEAVRASNVPDAVSCPRCKTTEAFRRLYEVAAVGHNTFLPHDPCC